MSVVRVIRLPSGKDCTLRTYVQAWARLKAMPPDHRVAGFQHFPEPAASILREMRHGLHDRINRHLPWWDKGRKWNPQWQADARRTAREVNTPRLIVRWAPPELLPRLAHRITRD